MPRQPRVDVPGNLQQLISAFYSTLNHEGVKKLIRLFFCVIPAKAGIQGSIFFNLFESWMPASAGMTNYDTVSC